MQIESRYYIFVLYIRQSERKVRTMATKNYIPTRIVPRPFTSMLLVQFVRWKQPLYRVRMYVRTVARRALSFSSAHCETSVFFLLSRLFFASFLFAGLLAWSRHERIATLSFSLSLSFLFRSREELD